MPDFVQTVRGPVAAQDLGFTLPHEHTYIHLWQIKGAFSYSGQLPKEQFLVEELNEYGSRGGRTLVDLTLPGIDRDPVAVRRLAERTGLNLSLIHISEPTRPY